MRHDKYQNDTYNDDSDFGPLFLNSGIGNSIVSYNSKKVKKLIKGQTEEVLKAIKKIGEACDRDIHMQTGIELSLIPDRRGRLLRRNLIYLSRKGVNPITGKEVNYYRVK